MKKKKNESPYEKEQHKYIYLFPSFFNIVEQRKPGLIGWIKAHF